MEKNKKMFLLDFSSRAFLLRRHLVRPAPFVLQWRCPIRPQAPCSLCSSVSRVTSSPCFLTELFGVFLSQVNNQNNLGFLTE
jgi:hypothetical protein